MQLPFIDHLLCATLVYPSGSGALTKTTPSIKKLVDLHFKGKCIDPESRCETVSSLLFLACLLICYFDKSLMLSYSSSDTQSFTAASSASLREGIDILKERADGLIIEEERTNRNDLLLLDVLKRFDQKFLMTFG